MLHLGHVLILLNYKCLFYMKQLTFPQDRYFCIDKVQTKAMLIQTKAQMIANVILKQ